jgi:branched-chain amino acid transport system substrate-binding protein
MRTVRPVVIALVAVGLVAAGCSSSSKSSSSSSSTATTAAATATTAAATPTTAATATTAGGGSSSGLDNASGGPLEQLAASGTLSGPAGTGLTRGVTSSAITVGCVYTSAAFAGYEQGLQARIARANKAGGVNGRMINLLPCKTDDAGVQANVQEVQQLVNENNVFAVFSATQNILPGSTDFLNNNQVPFYGWGFLPGFCGERWGFGWNGCLAGNGVTQSQVAHAAIAGNLADAIIKASGLPDSQVRLAVQAENSAAGKIGNEQYDTLYKARGADVVYIQDDFPATSTGADVTPYVQAIMASKPNIVMISTPFGDVGPIASGLRAAGYKGVSYDYTNYIPGLLQSSSQLAAALQGEYVNTQIVPQEENTPWIQQEDADLTAIGQKPFVTEGGAIGYAEAEEFIEQVQAVGSTLNTKTFDQTVNDGSFVSYTGITGGLGELAWPAAHFLPADCAAIVKIVGTSYQVVEPFACYSSLKLF